MANAQEMRRTNNKSDRPAVPRSSHRH